MAVGTTVSTKISLDNKKVVQSSGKILTLSGNTLIASSGTLKYLTDTSSTYDARSVTDAGFVTGLTSAISSNLSSNYYTKTVINNYTGATDTRIGDIESDVAISLTGASNGLTKVGDHDVKLGGVITESTIITDNRGTPVGIQYGGDYSANYTPRSLVDAGYVTGLTSAISSNLSGNYYTKTVINNYTGATDTRISDIESDVAISLTGASNGLTKVGDHDVELGGALTKNTNICGSYQYNINVNTINLTGITNGVNLTGVVTLKTQPSGSGGLLCINSTTGEICQTSLSAFGGVTGATNGLSVCSNQNIGFGGSLCNNTTITGDYDLCFGTSGDKLNKFELNTSDDVVINSDGIINMVLSGGTITTNDSKGLRYTSDYTNTFVANSLVSKAYVDGIALGLDAKSAVFVATVSENLNLSGVEIVDGITSSTGMRVLAKNQTNPIQNGIYVANDSGAWTRATDFDGTPEGEVTQGALIPVLSGNTNKNSVWILTTNDPITIGTTELNFGKFSQLLDVTDGNGIDISVFGETKQISVELSSNSGLVFNGTGLTIDSNIASSGLTWNGGKLFVNAISGGTGDIPVRIDGVNYLTINQDDIDTVFGGVLTNASNGLTKTGDTVILGGTLISPTTIIGDDTNGLVYQDNAITNKRGIQYANDYSSTFVNRSLVDKGYVDNVFSSITASNGLTRTGDTIVLGGVLDYDTCVDINNHALLFNGTGNTYLSFTSDEFYAEVSNNSCSTGVGAYKDTFRGIYTFNAYASSGNSTIDMLITPTELSLFLTDTNYNNGLFFNTTTGITTTFIGQYIINDNDLQYGIQYGGDYSSTFVERSLVDRGYVDNAIIASAVIAENGLTKSGYTITLGGVLNQNTTISGNSSYSLTIDKPNEFNVVCSSTIEMSSPSIIFSNYCDNTTNGSVVWLDYCGLTLSHEGFIDPSGNTTSSIFLGRNDLGNRDIVISSSNGGITIEASKYLDINTSGVTIQTTPQTYSLTNPNVLVWDNNDKLIKITCGDALGDKNNKYDVCVVNSNTTLTLTGDTYVVMVDTSSQPISITLSDDGLVSGRTVKIKDGSGNALSNNITITSPTLSFDRGSDAVINTDFGALELIYTEGVGACEWKVLSFYN